MRNWSAVSLCIFCLLLGCAGEPVPNEPQKAQEFFETPAGTPFLRSLPTGQGLVFIGMAGLRSDPKETIRFALEDAAQRIAVFQKVSGTFITEISIGSGAFDYTHNVYTLLDYDKEGSAQFIDTLQYNVDMDAIEYDNTLIIRVMYPSTLPSLLMYYPEYSIRDRRPGWVDDPPLQIEGYEVGVGFAGRHSALADTYATSFHNAIFAIIRNINGISYATDLDYRASGLFDYKTGSSNILYASGSLVNFYALDTWIDPNTKDVWTLAVAQKGD